MLKSIINNVKIAGISTVLPEKEVNLYDNKELYGGNIKKIDRIVNASGFHIRRVADDDVTAGDLCEQAAEDLLDKLKVDRKEIDAIILVTQYPDYIAPGTACFIHGRMGLKKECAAFDINQGCAGYAYGLWIASMMVNSGCKKVLLLVGDTPNKATSKDDDPTTAVPMFGDGGSATLLEYNEEAKPIYFDIGTDGTGAEVIWFKNGSFRHPPILEDFSPDGKFLIDAYMDKLAVVDFTLREVPPSINAVLSYAGWNKDEVDYYIMHQANKIIIHNIASIVNVEPEKFPIKSLSLYGNLSCGSIPSVMSGELNEEIKTKNLKLVLSGFGIGLSWVSIALETDKFYCSNIINYKRK